MKRTHIGKHRLEALRDHYRRYLFEEYRFLAAPRHNHELWLYVRSITMAPVERQQVWVSRTWSWAVPICISCPVVTSS